MSKEQQLLSKLFKLLLVLALLAVVIVVGYAVFFDLPAPSRDISIVVEPANV